MLDDIGKLRVRLSGLLASAKVPRDIPARNRMDSGKDSPWPLALLGFAWLILEGQLREASTKKRTCRQRAGDPKAI